MKTTVVNRQRKHRPDIRTLRLLLPWLMERVQRLIDYSLMLAFYYAQHSTGRKYLELNEFSASVHAKIFSHQDANK